MRNLPSGLFLAVLALGSACSKDSPTGPGQNGVMTLGTAVRVSGATDSERFFTVQVAAGAPTLRVTLSGGTGDADLVIRFGARPDIGNFDCASAGPTNAEECIVVNPAAGTWHILLAAFEAYAGAQLLAEITAAPTVTALTDGVALTNRSGAASSSRFFSIEVPAGATNLTVTTAGGTGDVDLFTRSNAYPSNGNFDCSSESDLNDETCTTPSPAAGTWYVLLRGFDAYSGVTLTASIDVPGTGLTLGTSVSVSGATDSERFFTVEVPAGAPALRVALSGGTGDADLAIRFGTRPDEFNFDCGSFGPSNAEECIVSSPAAGTWHIVLIGFEAYSGAQLLAEITAAPTVTALTSGVALTNQSGAEASSRLFSITVPAGATSLTVTTSGGTGDVDLFTRFNAHPSTANFDCVSDAAANDETCTVSSPAAGTWYVMLYGFEAYSGVTLTATVLVP